jgi:hypothetical protein
MQRIRNAQELKKLPAKTFKQEMKDLQTLKKRTLKKVQVREENIMILNSDRHKSTPDDRKNIQRMEAEKTEFENELLGFDMQEEQFHIACREWFL